MSEVIWHDLECGRYEQDLPLWLRLAAEVEVRVKPYLTLVPAPGASRSRSLRPATAWSRSTATTAAG